MAATGDHLGATLFIRPPLTARRYVFWPASTLQFDAGKSLRFVEAVCTHQKAEWANQPFLLSPNQQFIPWNLTGWPRENGCRRFRRVALLIYCNA
ncbi:MAG: hypothetical protein HOK43_00675 [Chloroflexi bacterium]|nr:hypothetical protein [Chloroflexota bacterium]